MAVTKADLDRAFAALATDQVQSMSDDDFVLYAGSVAAMLKAIEAEYARRNRIRRGLPDTGTTPIGCA